MLQKATILAYKEFPNKGITDRNAFRNSVKTHIMNNGSVYATINADIKNEKYLNTKGKQVNHAISIIGWDDNFSKDNFPAECRPKNNGAYIALNSWGSSWGNNGMFYISYEDELVEKGMYGVISSKILATTDIQKLVIEQEPAKKYYQTFDKFDKTNMKVKAVLVNGTTKEITNYTVSPERLDFMDKYVTISYTENGITRTVNQPVKVFDKKYQWGSGGNTYAYYNSMTKELAVYGTTQTITTFNTPWDKEDVRTIIIDGSIGTIPANAFSSLSNLKNVYVFCKTTTINNNAL